jgi:uncharacterized membrane protein SpoIIM required for sporulation
VWGGGAAPPSKKKPQKNTLFNWSILDLQTTHLAEGGGKLVLAERQKVDVDELLVNSSDFQQNRSADSGDTELESLAQRSTEFDYLFDGVPNPMHDSETELSEAEAKEQKERAELERKIHDARAELEAPSRCLCSAAYDARAFFSAFLLWDLWQWIRSPASSREPAFAKLFTFIFDLLSAEALEETTSEFDDPIDSSHIEMHDSKTELTEAETKEQEAGAAAENEDEGACLLVWFVLSLCLVFIVFIVLVLSYIFLFLSPIVLTVVAVSRGEHANLSTSSWFPALVPLVVHGILVTAYLHWAKRLDQKKKHEIRDSISEMERMISKREAHRKGSDVNCAAISEDEDELFKKKCDRLHDKKMVEFRQKHGYKLCLFALFVLGIFSVGFLASIDDGFVISLKPEFPYRPQFLGASLSH